MNLFKATYWTDHKLRLVLSLAFPYVPNENRAIEDYSFEDYWILSSVD